MYPTPLGSSFSYSLFISSCKREMKSEEKNNNTLVYKLFSLFDGIVSYWWCTSWKSVWLFISFKYWVSTENNRHRFAVRLMFILCDYTSGGIRYIGLAHIDKIYWKTWHRWWKPSVLGVNPGSWIIRRKIQPSDLTLSSSENRPLRYARYL